MTLLPRFLTQRPTAMVAVLIAFFAICSAPVDQAQAQFNLNQPGPLEAPKVIVIPSGSSLDSISVYLEQEGVIHSAFMFKMYTRLTGRGTNLKAGEYEIPAAASIERVAEIIGTGVSVDRRLTFPEGLTAYEMVATINAAEGLTGEITAMPREGSLFPNTYYYSKGDTRQSIVDRMQTQMATEIDKLWAARDPGLPINSKEEAIILASIVEKETAQVQEYPVVASVYLNRLRKGMRLQADPTTIYALADGKGKLDRPLTLNDLKVQSPYNTYVVEGLPPTAIASPGLGALDGVLRPAPTEYLYFVADGTGGHVFAKTFAEHRKNVAKWRKINK